MAFDPTGIAVRLLPDRAAGVLLVSWADARPAGTWYQVYLDGRLASWTTARALALPVGSGRHLVQVGAVPASEIAAAAPPAPPATLGGGSRGVVSWRGGAAGIVGGRPASGYRVFRGAAPGDPPSPAADVPVSLVPAGRTPGWCEGGWCAGGWCSGERAYRWSDPAGLSPGTWHYAVAAVDASGRQGDAATANVAIEAPPRAPTPIPGDPEGRRVAIDGTNPAAPALRWGHSPDWTAPPPAPTNEIQRIEASGGGGFGTMTVGWYGGGSGTVVLNSGDSAAAIEAKLETIGGLAGNVSVAGGPLGTAPVDVEFTGALAATNVDIATDGLIIVVLSAFASGSIVTILEGGA